MGCVLCLALVVSGCTRKKAEIGTKDNPIKFFFVPSVDARVLTEKAKEVEVYLEKHTDYEFSIQVPTSYIAVVEAFGTKRVDIASLNTFGYILAYQKYGAEALLTVERFGHKDYKGQIIARADSDIKELSDLKDKRFAYVDPSSTSGYLLPAKMLKDKDIEPSEHMFALRHDNVVTMVYQKQVDAGATFYSPAQDGVMQDARRLVKTQFPDVEDVIKVIALTDSIPNDPIVFRKDLPEKIKKDVQQALIKFVHTKEGKELFHELYGVTNLIEATDSVYDGVRDILSKMGKSASDLMN